MTLFFLTIILFLIIDPLGNVATYLRLMKDVPAEKQKTVALREMVIALCVMILFNELGELLFQFLGLSEIGLRIASGVILFIIALKILFPSKDNIRSQEFPGEPYVFPIAIPLLAGPALLATIMLYAHLEPSRPIMLGAILIAWAAASLILFFSSFFQRVLGNNGLAACERLMGMVLVLISIQRIAAGIQLFLTGQCCD
jgi:multiple antibiotic resistance protein